jgi:hypothetical protein
MSPQFSEILLMGMVILTLLLLPLLDKEVAPRIDEPRRATEELHIKPKRKS